MNSSNKEMKVVVITGATSGIGKSCAQKFLKEGYAVVFNGRNQNTVDEAVLELKKVSDHVVGIAADVSIEADCKKLIEKAIESFGRVDVLINNAGISMRALFQDVDLKVMHQLMNINFWGTVYCTKYALPYLLKSEGSLIGISSVAGKKGLPARSAYSAGKFAMEGFLETVRIENLKRNLHVLIVNPGFVASKIRMNALQSSGDLQNESPRDEAKMMQPEELANHIYKATVKRKRNIILTVNGKLTIWLNKFFPSLVDKLVYNHMAKEPNSPLK